MKKITYLLGALFFAGTVNAQIYSDDFEAYNAGALGPQSPNWTTWSGTEGGTEDGIVSTAQASSGTKSIYFNSTASGGGPQDCVMDFGSTYTSGIFTFQADFYVNTGKSAYFNFQAVAPIGTTWAMNANFANGVLTIDDGVTAELATGAFTHASWFTLEIKANLTIGLWETFIDGNSIGVWENSINSIRSIDIFPLQGSQFYVDDVSYDHTTYALPTLNAALSGIDMGGNIATQVVNPVVSVLNGGSTPLTSFDVVLDYNGTPYTQNITGQNLASLASYQVTFTNITLAPGSNVATATVSNVNGGTDNDPADNSTSITVNPVVPAAGKMVVGEEGTGTWCQWCPRGAVYMDLFEQEFGDFWAGIAVHNADPMTVATYDTGMGALIGGYPSALVDRGTDIDPSGMGPDFYSRLQTAPKAFITNGATWDPVTRMLYVSVTADFQAAANNNYKIACVLTEDGVTGTGSSYNQSNAYAGGGNGVMGGFEALPNPVPASQMVYDHVARAIQPSFTGFANSFPATVNAGDVHTVNFLYILPATWDETKIHIIGMMMDPSGRIDNAGKATITEAVANGFVGGTMAGTEELTLDQIDAMFQLFPNPTSENATVALNLQKESTVEVRLIDMAGQEIAARNYGSMNGSSNIQLNTADLTAGVYVVEVTINNEKMIKRLIIE
jgi:Secretion system C-terminal sorting domain/Outer membrane protein Omp28